MSAIHYDTYKDRDGNLRGIMLSEKVYQTNILGHAVAIQAPGSVCSLTKDGKLALAGALEGDARFDWDFGSYAIDTPPMVRASAEHDAFCRMTDEGLLPWECRALADANFRDRLIAEGTPPWRAWVDYMAVRRYSKCVAYWKRKPYNQPAPEGHAL
jgi:hypothetical protein